MTKKMQHFSLKVLTINIHKGFTAFNRRFILPELRDAVHRQRGYCLPAGGDGRTRSASAAL
jgi:hypothetical protein